MLPAKTRLKPNILIFLFVLEKVINNDICYCNTQNAKNPHNRIVSEVLCVWGVG